MVMQIENAIAQADGLHDEDMETVRELVYVWRDKYTRNALREAYYMGHIKPKDLGIAVPPKIHIRASCGWPRKVVDYLAARSQFDGFTVSDSGVQDELRAIVDENDMKNAYVGAVTSEMMQCFAMALVTAGDAGEPDALISFVPASASAGIWDDRHRCLEAGMCVVAVKRKNNETNPTWVDIATADNLITIRYDGLRWNAEYKPHSMGRTFMEPLVNGPTLMRPFGHSRITRAVMHLADNFMREAVRAEVAAEFAASPQKYLLGADKDALGGTPKWDAAIDALFAINKDGDGDVPTFGQLSQPSMEPHISYVRSLAAQFAGETNIPLSALGVVTDNPSSAEAIYAAKEDAVIDAQRLNASNGRSLVNVAYMALAIKHGTDFATERAANPDLMAQFANPAMPSIVSQSDAMVKQISAIPWLADSDVALEQLGYNDEQRLRLKTDRKRAQGLNLLTGATNGNTTVGAGSVQPGD